ncbi:hypothetical protein KIH74_03695 [Kineosporia sp. J2-2]|uniref:Uncharacterized protein n=1 Tax=Kineosporia corallincola TaxID=2835133 RepID=A0ABS5TAB5_9ACTN|nr:hypothetical protein [Kineosporia corallincola]MBT0768012.1 hypothetical protein [Kineosporia corallincola]
MNTMTSRLSTAVTAASGMPLSAARYRSGAMGLASVGAVCPQVASLALSSPWAGAEGGFAGIEAGHTTAVRQNSDFFKPRYGSQASDGTG